MPDFRTVDVVPFKVEETLSSLLMDHDLEGASRKYIARINQHIGQPDCDDVQLDVTERLADIGAAESQGDLIALA